MKLVPWHLEKHRLVSIKDRRKRILFNLSAWLNAAPDVLCITLTPSPLRRIFPGLMRLHRFTLQQRPEVWPLFILHALNTQGERTFTLHWIEALQ